MKKTLSLVLSIVMVLSLCAALCVSTSAASENIAKGKSYTTSQLFRQSNVTWSWDENSPIAYPDENDKSLTDGAVGASDAAYTDEVWAGFNGNGTPDYDENGYSWITVDLGSVQNISKAVLYVGTSNLTSGIGAKNMTVEFFVSDDNANWTSIGSAAPEDITTSSVEAVAVEATASGRYVQARLVRTGWMFISEVEVYGAASAPVVEDKVINLLAQEGTTSETNCEAGDLAYDWKADGLEIKCLGTMWPSLTIKFNAPVTIDVANAYLEIEATVTGGNGTSIRLLGPVDDPGAVETDDIYLQHFDTDITPDGGGDAPSGSTISYKLPVSELAYCIYDAEHAYAGKNPITESEISFTGLHIFASGKDCVVNISKLNVIVPGSSAPSAPTMETITVDGDLSDNGWAADKWIVVNGETGYWQNTYEIQQGTATAPDFGYKYQLRADETKLYGAVVVDGDAVAGGNGKGTFPRLWIRDNDEATIYTHFFNIEFDADGNVVTGAKYNTSTTENKGANIENSTFVASAKSVDGKTYFEFSVDIAEFCSDGTFDYFLSVSQLVGEVYGCLYHPASEIGPTNPEGGENHIPHKYLPFNTWHTEKDATVNVADIALGEVASGTPGTGDAGIYAIAGLALVALLGTAVVIKKRA